MGAGQRVGDERRRHRQREAHQGQDNEKFDQGEPAHGRPIASSRCPGLRPRHLPDRPRQTKTDRIRRFAREIGVSIYDVPGNGPSGRISMEDVKAYSKQLHQQGSGGHVATAVSHTESLPDFSKFGAIETEAFNKLRQTSANHLSYAWTTIPHVTQFDKADITHLEKLRKANGKKTEAVGGKLTMTAILVKVIEM